MDISNFEMSYRDFLQLTEEERSAFTKKGFEACKPLANDYLKQHPHASYVVYSFEKGEFRVVEDGKTDEIVITGSYSPLDDHIREMMKGRDKVLFGFSSPLMIERIYDPIFTKEFEGYY